MITDPKTKHIARNTLQHTLKELYHSLGVVYQVDQRLQSELHDIQKAIESVQYIIDNFEALNGGSK